MKKYWTSLESEPNFSSLMIVLLHIAMILHVKQVKSTICTFSLDRNVLNSFAIALVHLLPASDVWGLRLVLPDLQYALNQENINKLILSMQKNSVRNSKNFEAFWLFVQKFSDIFFFSIYNSRYEGNHLSAFFNELTFPWEFIPCLYFDQFVSRWKILTTRSQISRLDVIYPEFPQNSKQ